MATQGERHDRFVWATMLTQLETAVLCPTAAKAAFKAADEIRSSALGARLAPEDAVDAAAEE